MKTTQLWVRMPCNSARQQAVTLSHITWVRDLWNAVPVAILVSSLMSMVA